MIPQVGSTCVVDGSTTECVYHLSTTTIPVLNYDPMVSMMIGGLLMFFVAYWFIGLVRKWNT